MQPFPNINLSRPYVDMKIVTWNKDSHGLFDYESKILAQNKFCVHQTSFVYRSRLTSEITVQTLEQIKQFKPIFMNNALLTQIIKKKQVNPENIYHISIDHEKDPSNMQIQNTESEHAQLIVRSLKNKQGVQKGYALQIGDIIKLGRIQYHVFEMRLGNETTSIRQNNLDLDCKVYELTENLKGSCKICLSQQQEQTNFFISPCKCRGSCRTVHINCLKTWIESKIIISKDQSALTYNFTKFQCEICKEPYPTIVNKNLVDYELFAIHRPNTPYIMLQSIENQVRGNKTMYMIGPPANNEKIKLGRGHHCLIRITDISVSREHAHINFENNRFMIYDNNSKFGTLIRLQNDLPITNEKFAIQIGRTVITFALKTEKLNKKIS